MMSSLCRASSLGRSASLPAADGWALPSAPYPARPFTTTPRPGATQLSHGSRCNALSGAGLPARPPRTRRNSSRGLVKVRAQRLPGDGPRESSVQHATTTGKGGVLALLSDSCSKFLGRYDPVTIGTGSLLVTGYCYFVHGQTLEEALNLTIVSTVVGMVAQEVMYNQQDGDARPH